MGGNIITGITVPKIDRLAVNGLLGVHDSLAYKINEIEKHHHNWERWMAAAAVPAGETHIADRIGVNQTAFQLDGGDDTWGAWAQILGSSDTPVMTGGAMFDIHRIIVSTTERSGAAHAVQVAFGATAAAALIAETYSSVLFVSSAAHAGEAIPVMIRVDRNDIGTKVWARVWVVGQNTGTMDFFYGIHEYPG